MKRHLFASLTIILCLSLGGCLQALHQEDGTFETADPTGTAVIAITPDDNGEPSPEPIEASVTPEQPAATEDDLGDEPTAPLESATPAPPAETPLPTVQVNRPELDSIALWRAQQQDRRPFDAPVVYRSPGQVLLLWFDPKTHQHIPLGWIAGEVQAQAKFRLQGSWIEALEVLYVPNETFGLVLSDALLGRMASAGHSDPKSPIETYIYLAPDMSAQ